jgi:ABC-type uncharacterized transport system substrate-binding protein
LVRRPVVVLIATGVTAALAAKASTITIPIVFNTAGDEAFVDSVSRGVKLFA